jgi:hypothetical protein
MTSEKKKHEAVSLGSIVYRSGAIHKESGKVAMAVVLVICVVVSLLSNLR